MSEYESEPDLDLGVVIDSWDTLNYPSNLRGSGVAKDERADYERKLREHSKKLFIASRTRGLRGYEISDKGEEIHHRRTMLTKEGVFGPQNFLGLHDGLPLFAGDIREISNDPYCLLA